MRRTGLVWGLLLIIMGVLFLLNTLDILNIAAGDLIWPLALVLVGVWILLGGVQRHVRWSGLTPSAGEQVAIPLEGAREARIKIQHGAGKLDVTGGATGDALLAGSGSWVAEYTARRRGDTLDVTLRGGAEWWERMFSPWRWGEGWAMDWTLALNGDVPLALDLETGANEAHLDLRDLRVGEVKLQSGASSTRMTLPAQAGHTRVTVRAGAASVEVNVPDGVAARIRARGGLADLKVDERRFPRSGDLYQSPDYDGAANKAELDVEMGVGEVKVR